MKRLPLPAGLLVAAALVSTAPALAAAAIAAPAAPAASVVALRAPAPAPNDLVWQ